MTSRKAMWSVWAVALVAAACNDPTLAPDAQLTPSFHRDGERHRTVVVDPDGRHDAITIQAGIDLVAPGGRVQVKAGTYTEAVVISKGLTLEGIDRGSGAAVITPPGSFPGPTIQVTAAEPVAIRRFTINGAQRGIQGVGRNDLTIEDNILLGNTLSNAPLIGTSNSALTTGGRAHVVIARNFLDGLGLPIQNFGIITSGDVDALIAHNRVRRTGASCIWARQDASLTGITNVDIIDNDLDLCHRTIQGSPIVVGSSANASVPSPQLPLSATGVVNIVGNLIRNSDGSCFVTNAIRWEYLSGRIEHNRILGAVAACAAATTTSSPAAVWVGSLRGFFAVAPVIRFNDIVGNAQAGLRVAPNITSPLDARCNYWGSASGPSGVGAGTGDAVLVETGGAAPIVTPFATGPIAARHEGEHGDGHGHDACRLEFSLWSAPVNLGDPINTSANESNPALSPDELSLYFQSNRPGGLGGFDLWRSRRACRACAWDVPVNLGPVVNGPGNEYAPNLSTDGHLLFFASDRPGGSGLTDIYVSHRSDPDDDFGWNAPVALGSGVNTALADQAPASLGAPEPGANLYFSRGPTIGTLQDIYKVFITPEGETPAPAVLVTELSLASANDARPTVRSDGREVLFFSDRAGGFGGLDIWVSNRRSVRDPWSAPVNVGAPINSTAADQHPNLSRDGRTLVFSSNRAGSVAGSADIWMATRTRIEDRDWDRRWR